MSKFLKALAKVGLVELEGSEKASAAQGKGEELSQEDISRILADAKKDVPQRDSQSDGATAPAQPIAPAPAYETGVAEGRALDSIYSEMRVPASPFPAEKLLKLLDGLRAMDANTRKAAVLAMDAADDTWTIEDAILDARRKIDALEQAKQRVRATVQATEESAKRELEETAKYQDEVTSTIKKQMADLEAMLQKEMENVATQKAAIQSKIEAERSAATREAARFDAEIGRLSEIPKTFHAQEAVKNG